MDGHLTPRAGEQAMVSWHSACGQLGRYRLLQPIGHGGTAVVHLAIGPDDRMVAVKMLLLPSAGSAETRCRLAREVSAMQRIRSPFVAEVIDADVTGSIPYVVTTLVQGPTLAQVVATGGPLRGADLQRLAYGLAEGLAAVHAAGIVHRDLKPGNVMMSGGDPVLIDFGIAYHTGDSPMTQTGTFIGTPGYLAPEVISGQRAQAPADVHAWATTVGFAARGETIYGDGPHEVVFCRITRGQANLDGIHGALYPLVAAALLRQPSQRPSAAWLASQIAGLDLAEPEPPDAVAERTLAVPGRPLASVPQWQAAIASMPWPNGSSGDSLPAAGQGPAEFTELLPAVRYAPTRGPTRKQKPAAKRARTAGARRQHPVLALAALALAISAGYVLPGVGTLAVTALLTILRAGDRTRSGLAVRRESRGRRMWDPLLVAWSAPWGLARSAIETVLLAPVLLAAAAIVVTGWTIGFHVAQTLPDWPAITAVYVALNCLGPRSRPARRELNRGLNAVASTPLGVAVAVLTAGVLAMSVAGLVVIQMPPMWPLPAPPSPHVHVSGFGLNRFHG